MWFGCCYDARYPTGYRRPIAYVSQTLNEHEKHYGEDRQTGFGDYVWLETVPLVSLRPSFHDPH